MLLIVLWAVLDASGRDPGLRSLLSKLTCPRQTGGQTAKGKGMRISHVPFICSLVFIELLFCTVISWKFWAYDEWPAGPLA